MTIDHWTFICIVAAGVGFDVGLAVIVPSGLDIATLSTALYEDMSLQRILAREALVAMGAWERLHGEMDPLMALQIVIPVEALRTLVAFERPFDVGRRGGLRWLTAI